MTVNKIDIRLFPQSSKQITLPIDSTWNYLGLDSSVDKFEDDSVNKIIGTGNNFEVLRFEHSGSTGVGEINYDFYFFSGGSMSDITNWSTDYVNQEFTVEEIFYNSNSFINSFFKLDLYDSPDDKSQKNYLTIVIPTNQGLTKTAVMQRTPVKLKTPKFKLDYIGDNAGFFIYWMRNKDYLNLDTFYMSAKFYNAKIGQFVKMMTGSNSINDTTSGPQSKLGNKYNFDSTKFFYYKVKLNYDTTTYSVFNLNNQHLGDSVPIKWFEYINP